MDYLYFIILQSPTFPPLTPAPKAECGANDAFVMSRIAALKSGFTGTSSFETVSYDATTKIAAVIEARTQATSKCAVDSSLRA